MKKGFFSSSNFQSKERIPINARCGLCGLYKHCKSSKMPPTGRGLKKILFVAEAPGELEDRKNTQLIGQAGQLFRKYLRRMNIDLNKDCWKTNAIICRPRDNETPDKNKIIACRPNLMQTIKQYQPNVIVLLGKVAIRSLVSVLWKEDEGTVSKWAGYCIPCHAPNAWIIPTYHPSFLLRTKNRALEKIFMRHLRMAVEKSKSKPWKTIPSYKDNIDIIMNPSHAAKVIHKMISKGGPVAFDYEANCLKPEGKGPKIYSCSICWKGKKTIAYPWKGEAIDATDQLLKTSMPKIASNIKFEDRWTRTMLGHTVKNWWWDTMIAAHVLNYTRDVTGLKFQAFVLLGAEPYDEHIKPLLKSVGKSRFNRIQDIDLKDLLLYNGLDSLLEYKVAMEQMKQFGPGDIMK